MTLLKRGDRIGNNEIIDYIGSGRFGEVYRVEHDVFEEIALKILKDPIPEGHENDPWEEPYFLSKILHKNIIRVYHPDIHIINDLKHRYFTMEFINGISLLKYHLKYKLQKKFIPVNYTLDIIKQICSGMKVCHENFIIIVHKDLKPENILITIPDRDEMIIKITDFGLVRLPDLEYESENIKGSLHYIPPEISSTNPKRDVYAIGVIFYQLLTNKFPYDINDKDDLTSNQPWLKNPTSPSSVNKEICKYLHDNNLNEKCIDEIVLKAISKDINERYNNAGELLEEILKIEK
ncbi:MAG: serine/threonine protein kinase [Methanobrevibacter sp.]|nr:serine/threonine protein kinase [Methanobrevibacter sp.]